jgi:hypothetical protein
VRRLALLATALLTSLAIVAPSAGATVTPLHGFYEGHTLSHQDPEHISFHLRNNRVEGFRRGGAPIGSTSHIPGFVGILDSIPVHGQSFSATERFGSFSTTVTGRWLNDVHVEGSIKKTGFVNSTVHFIVTHH